MKKSKSLTRFFFKKVRGVLIIAPSRQHVAHIEKALNFIQKRDNKAFKKVHLALTAIFIVPHQGYQNELIFPDRIWFCERSTIAESSLVYLAGLLVHEAHHVDQYKGGRRRWGVKSEQEALTVQVQFLQKLGGTKIIEWLYRQFRGKWWAATTKALRSSKNFRVFLDLYKSGKLKLVSSYSIQASVKGIEGKFR